MTFWSFAFGRGRGAGTNESNTPARRPIFECLEDRRLLSVAVPVQDAQLAPPPVPPGQVASLVNPGRPLSLSTVYSGSLKGQGAQASPGQRAAPRSPLVLELNSFGADGSISGTLSSATLGNVSFNGQVTGRRFTLTFSDGVSGGTITGTATGRIQQRGDRMAGRLAASDGTRSRFTVRSVNNSRALTPSGVTDGTGGTDGTGTTGGTDGNPLLSEHDGLVFTGSYSGNAQLRQNGPGVDNPGSTENYSATLRIDSMSLDDLLRGTMSVPGIGSFIVIGVVKGNEMTLILTGDGAGAARFQIQANANSGNVGQNIPVSLNGTFALEANNVHTRGTVNLTGQVYNAGEGNSNNGGTGGGGTGGGGTGGTGGDQAGNTLQAARDLGVISGTRTVTDSVSVTDMLDFYRFQTVAGGNIQVTLNGSSGDADLQLLDANGTILQQSDNGGTTAEVVNFTAPAAGVFFVRVDNESATTTSSYSLTVDAPDGTDPGTGTPTDPGTGTPTDPGTGTPTDPGTDTPTDPGTGTPTDPGTGGGTEPLPPFPLPTDGTAGGGSTGGVGGSTDGVGGSTGGVGGSTGGVGGSTDGTTDAGGIVDSAGGGTTTDGTTTGGTTTGGTTAGQTNPGGGVIFNPSVLGTSTVITG